MSYIERSLNTKLLQAAKHFPAIVLTGARQVGKTTLLAHMFPHFHYVTLDRPLAAEQAEKDSELFLLNHPPPVLIDEIQYAPAIFRYLKLEIDKKRSLYGQFILTGSQKFSMMKEVSESLAGRVALFQLEGLSIKELIDGKIISPNLERETLLNLFTRGGYPELWINLEKPYRIFLDSYIGTYLERDVRQALAVGNLRDFERFIRACAIRSGQILNKSDMARDVGISVPTVTEWLSVLVALGQVVLLEPWFGNLTKRLVKSPKLYMSDPAMMMHLLGYNEKSLFSSPSIGALWETLVFSELRKQLATSDSTGSLWFYRDQSQTEVDFVLEEGGALTLYECKWTDQPDKKDARNMEKVARSFELSPSQYKVQKMILISRAVERIRLTDQLEIRPISQLLDKDF